MFLVGKLIVGAVKKSDGDDDRDGSPSAESGGPAPEGSPAIEGDGTFLVGEDLAPGRYVAMPPDDAFCFWERHSGPEDTSGERGHVIVSGGPGAGRMLVEVGPSDHAFENDGCGDWYPYVPPAQPSTTIGVGEWAVGEDIEPGTYVSEGGEHCHWAFYSGFGQTFEEFIDGSSTDGTGSATIVVEPTHALVTTAGCAEWTKQ